MAASLLRGPAYLPSDLFAGSDAAVLRGLRVHANSISHARLIALEDTFPRTRAYLGEGEFNRLSRRFIDEGGAQRRSANDIGAGFEDGLADPRAADIARVEWAWLESYHAADACALTLADLHGLDEDELLGLPVRRHPAVRTVTLASDAAPLIDPAFAADTLALLVTRPDVEVRLSAIERAAVEALGMAEEIAPVGNLIVHLAEHHSGGGAAIAALIDAGAFEKG